MTWVLAIPAKAQKASKLSFSLSIGKSGKGKLHVSLPNTVAARLDLEKADACNVFFGENENTGRVWIQPDENGAHKVAHLAHCISVRIDPLPGTRLQDNSETLDFGAGPDQCGVIFDLPAWARPGGNNAPQHTTEGEVRQIDDARDRPKSFEINGTRLICGAFEITLSKSQAVIMDLLAKNFGKTVWRQQLLDALYSTDPNGGADDKLIDVWISKIRSNLADAKVPLHIVTHRNVGWELRRPIA